MKKLKSFKIEGIHPLKRLLIMKIAVFILVLGHFPVYAGNYSQETRLTVKENEIELGKLLNQIEEKTEFFFFYSNDEVDRHMKVSVNATNKPITDILDQALRGSDVAYQVKDRVIILVKKHKLEEIMQQHPVITGTVTDAAGEPLPGVNISVKGTTTGVITDADGKYSLNVTDGRAILVYSFIGYLSQEVTVGDRTKIDVALRESLQALDEVVVVGYGVQKKVNLTGAVGHIKSDVLAGQPVTNIQELLQGKSPGLNVTKSSGQPGSGASMDVRGTSTIGGSSGVLVIIDGVPGNINTLNSNDIESISILKDAASAAIYGSRAANGVILVTTKGGTDRKELQVTVNTSVGVQNPLHFIDFVGAEDFMNLYNLARTNEGNDPLYTQQDFDDFRTGKRRETIWYKEIFKHNQLINNNHVAFGGKTKMLKYNVSAAYDYQSGSVERNNYNRYIVKPDLTFIMTKWLSLRANIQYTETHLKEPQGGSEGYLVASARIEPVAQVANSQGQYMNGTGLGGNPIGELMQGGSNFNKYKEMLSIFSADINPVAGWHIRPMLSLRTTDRRQHNYTRPITFYNADGSVNTPGLLTTQTLYEATNADLNRIMQVTSDYFFSLSEKHNFSFLAGYSQEYSYDESYSASRRNPAFNDIFVLDVYQESKDNGGTAGRSSMASGFGRVAYDFDGKYLLEANVRIDGASRFTEGRRTGVFPSFAGGWNVHRERFLEDNPYLSRLKLRGSWGILGDALKIGRYETRDLLSFNYRGYAYNGNITASAWSSASYDPNITWEKAEMTNLGIELGFLDNRIFVEVEYFNNIRKDILYRAPVPMEYGLSAPYINALKMRNRGMEFLAGYNDRFGDWKIGADVNLNFSKNRVLDLYGTGPWIGGNSFTDVGLQLEMPYGYEAIGLFQDPNDPDLAKQTNVTAGNIKYKDQLTVDTNGDGIPDQSNGKIDGDDRIIINDNVPVRFGANLSAGYKDFDLSASFYGKFNNKRYISGYEGWAFYLTTNARPMHKDSWTPDNPDATYPRITTNMTGNDTNYSSYWMRKANYLKIQNVQLGYTLPASWRKTVNVDYLRVYLSGQNLGILSDYIGFDPEGGYYPLMRTFSFGIQLQF
ncbi:MAG: TonB-dependent receptor [Tannerella sp.]|jgi:TonB-linked SusC/RagA family outer membrane protein|nr:TonB-dependent receptor [Tannerella sp.]